MMTTFATLFSGGELAGVGMRNAGLVGAAVDGERRVDWDDDVW